ncbi:TPA: hypothetical protein ACYHTB_000482 [Vibrio cholerae]
MKATVNDFFGANLEQEVLDEVAILPYLSANYRNGFSKDVSDIDFTMFERVEIALSAFNGDGIYASLDVGSTALQKTEWAVSAVISNQTGTSRANVYVLKSGTSLTITCTNQAGTMAEAGVKYIIGYKRRISRVGIDELMSAMSLPNLIANADLTDNPINQRNFNGNWSSLAVGAYGYDQWIKVSATHMGAVIEAGKYRPSTKHTFTKDDVVLGEFMSPASGHWIVAVPFATSGKFDLYAGQFKRPWHPVLDGVHRCRRYFEKGKIFTVGDGAVAYASGSAQMVPKRVNAVARVYDNAGNLGKCSFDSANDIPATTSITSDRNTVLCGVSNRVASTNSFIHFNWQVEGVITLAEVNGQITTV